MRRTSGSNLGERPARSCCNRDRPRLCRTGAEPSSRVRVGISVVGTLRAARGPSASRLWKRVTVESDDVHPGTARSGQQPGTQDLAGATFADVERPARARSTTTVTYCRSRPRDAPSMTFSSIPIATHGHSCTANGEVAASLTARRRNPGRPRTHGSPPRPGGRARRPAGPHPTWACSVNTARGRMSGCSSRPRALAVPAAPRH